jgi:adenylate cyclase
MYIPPGKNIMGKFIQELQRRNVIKAAISYLAISWALLEAADMLFPMFDVPGTMILYILYVLGVGFPLWLVFAYIYELTPSGFRKTVEVAPEQSISSNTGKRLNGLIIGGLSLAVVFLVADKMFDFTTSGNEPEINKSIAILPFQNLTGEDDDYFTIGVTEDILTQVSKIGDLRVLSRFTLKDYDTKGKTIEQIGKELGVGFLLTGSIRRYRDDLRISCQLVQVNPEEEKWAENFDKRMEDVFAIQSEVASEVAKYLKVKLTDQQKINIEKKPTENMEAYNKYLLAKSLYDNANKEDNELAIKFLKKVIEMDPNFSLAWSSLASAFSRSISNHGVRPYSYFDSVIVLNKKALALDPESAEARSGLGYAYWVKGEDDIARTYYEQALEKNPNDPRSNNALGLMLRNKGELDKAIALFKKAGSIEPLHSHVWGYNLGMSYLFLGMYDKSLEYTLEVYKSGKSKAITLNQLALIYYLKDNYHEAERSIQELLVLDNNTKNWNIAGSFYLSIGNIEKAREYFNRVVDAPDFDKITHVESKIGLAAIMKESGNAKEAQEMLNHIYKDLTVESKTRAQWVSYQLAVTCALMNNKKEALEWIRKRIEFGYLMHDNLQKDRLLRNLHNDPEFLQIVEELKIKRSRIRDKVVSKFPDSQQLVRKL